MVRKDDNNIIKGMEKKIVVEERREVIKNVK